jgi:hypothetical protein
LLQRSGSESLTTATINHCLLIICAVSPKILFTTDIATAPLALITPSLPILSPSAPFALTALSSDLSRAPPRGVDYPGL